MSRWRIAEPRCKLIALVWLWLGLGASNAHATARMVISLSGPTTVLVDQAVMHSAGAGARCVLNLGAGVHLLSFSDSAGTVLQTVSLDVPEGADIQARFGPTLVITSPAELAATLEAPSFDSNEGQRVRPTTTYNSQYAGNSAGFQDALGSAGSAVGARLEATGPMTGYDAASSAGSYVGTVLRTAEAGGMGAFSGTNRAGRQGRPLPKDEPRGTVVFFNPGGHPTVIYLEGFVLAVWEPGTTTETRVKLEVGRHMLEIRDLQTDAVLHKGELRIDEDFEVQLRIDAISAPEAVNRSWAWQAW
jgi:hypothetical protein